MLQIFLRSYIVYYDDSIPESLKEIIDVSLNSSSAKGENKTRVYIRDFNSTNYNIYAGSALPFAEQEAIRSLKEIIDNEIFNQILLEVNFFEM